MSIKSILCIYGGESFEAAALEAACRLAARRRAELRILHLSPPVVVFPDLYGVDVATLEKENIARAERARRAAADAAAEAQIAFSDGPGEGTDASLPRAVFIGKTGYMDDVVPAYGRACDLVIAGRNDTEVSGDIDAILAALLDTCTPTLVVPRGADAAAWFADPAQTVALAWDGSAVAGRALRSLEMILAAGQAVEVICVRPKGGKTPGCAPEEAAHWMSLHGFAGRISYSGPYAMSDGEAILVEARRAGAGLLVMGAYGHDHWREMLVGGATDCVLKTGDLPLLLCH